MSTMDRHNTSKLNSLLSNWPAGTVSVQPWLDKQGVYRQLTDQYTKSGWIEKVGRGAYLRAGDTVDWTGALYALQAQLGLSVHIAGSTALTLQGYAHNLAFGSNQAAMLFGTAEENLPAWFKKSPWNKQTTYIKSNLFHRYFEVGLNKFEKNGYQVMRSTPERAIMELVYLLPDHLSFDDVIVLMESLTTLRPKSVQQLLENCHSIKVKRLFMWLAEYCQHQWVTKLDLSQVDFGKGKRSIVKGGKYDKKYAITVPDMENTIS